MKERVPSRRRGKPGAQFNEPFWPDAAAAVQPPQGYGVIQNRLLGSFRITILQNLVRTSVTGTQVFHHNEGANAVRGANVKLRRYGTVAVEFFEVPKRGPFIENHLLWIARELDVGRLDNETARKVCLGADVFDTNDVAGGRIRRDPDGSQAHWLSGSSRQREFRRVD